ncbi:MAG TPA: HAD family hydrolase, partial [Desulfobacteraceae bacterium]|nr:HAD family hydrolase [Desulfobacteraceae bacterium]
MSLKTMFHQAAIFDLDGTLLDTLEDIADSINRVLRARGFPTHKTEAYRFFVGDGSQMLVKRSLPENERSDESVARYLNAFKNDYANTWDVKTKPYEGIPELLDCLAKKGVRTAVCSNKPHAFTILCVEKLLNNWHFDKIIGQSSRHPKKPAPDSALGIARDMGIATSEIL